MEVGSIQKVQRQLSGRDVNCCQKKRGNFPTFCEKNHAGRGENRGELSSGDWMLFFAKKKNNLAQSAPQSQNSPPIISSQMQLKLFVLLICGYWRTSEGGRSTHPPGAKVRGPSYSETPSMTHCHSQVASGAHSSNCEFY